MKRLHTLTLIGGLTLAGASSLIAQTAESYLDPKLPASRRVELLMKEMTLDEKIGQMCQYVGEATQNTAGNKDEEVNYVLGIGERAKLVREGKIGSFLKVPTYKEANYLQKLAEESRLKIPVLIANDAIHGHGMYEGPVTIFPSEIAMASSFDTTLAYKVAEYTAREMRATGNHWTFSPNIEIVRDARWGRFGETFGEDPYLVGQLGKAMIQGYQGKDFSGPEQVLACAKHFVAGGIAINGLNGGPADISERTLHEIFFPPFIDAINAGVFTIMPAHNEINGIPCHAHGEYLTDLIRKKWGFAGFYISDWMDIERLHSVHRIAATEKEADIIAVNAGLDMHMHGPKFFDYVKEAVNEGKIPLARIDEAASKILYAKFQLGLFENRYVDPARIEKTLLKQEHRDLALDGARKSIVLLKNQAKLLPLRKNLSSIFVTGPNADNQAILGDWSRLQPEDNVTTVLEGIRRAVSPQTRVDYLESKSYHTMSSELLAQAKQRASQADVAVIVVGENSIRTNNEKTSGENLDRATLELAGQQLALVQAVESAGKPVIVVLVNGAPIASEWTVENTEAILEAWEPGMYGGQAVAEVIFGDYNPSGRLPVTIPRSAGHLQTFYNHKPSITHRGKFYRSERTALFEFGHGLSYTEFRYSDLKMKNTLSRTDDLDVTVTVENAGERAGDEIVLVYLNDVFSSVTTPVKKLVGFTRVSLAPKEKRTVSFTIKNEQFKLYDKSMNHVIEPGDFTILIGDGKLKATVTIP
jgi:beta-glucosidase